MGGSVDNFDLEVLRCTLERLCKLRRGLDHVQQLGQQRAVAVEQLLNLEVTQAGFLDVQILIRQPVEGICPGGRSKRGSCWRASAFVTG